MAGAGIITIIVLLVLLPFAALADLFRFFKWLEGPPRPPGPPLTPQEKNIYYACGAAGLLAAAAYAPFVAASWFGETPAALVAEFVRAPLDPPVLLAAWVGALILGATYLVIGLRGASDGPHAGLWGFWSAALPIVGGLVLWRRAPWVFYDPAARGGLIVLAVICAVRCWIALRGDTAERAVRRNLRRKNAALRPARRRWVFF